MTRWLTIAVAVLVLPACAHLPVGTDGLSYDARRGTLATVDAWDMRGRLAVDTGGRAFQGSFDWHQRADALDLAVRGPLGAGLLQVAGTPNHMTFTARGETRTLTDPEAELSALLGWWLPVGSLHAWLLGLTDPAFRAQTQDGADGTLAAFEQRLWRVVFPSYQVATLAGRASGVLVPRRIDLTHGELKLRLTIDDWRPAAP
ncbi:MAG TPA: lipoprotein insertase outer membrane protein LolB [Gammaproteobacteria bacterium]|nr:lipoprotein insertase outer membrane protein LolB [Gammaproteobacteria bacterium]